MKHFQVLDRDCGDRVPSTFRPHRVELRHLHQDPKIRKIPAVARKRRHVPENREGGATDALRPRRQEQQEHLRLGRRDSEIVHDVSTDDDDVYVSVGAVVDVDDGNAHQDGVGRHLLRLRREESGVLHVVDADREVAAQVSASPVVAQRGLALGRPHSGVASHHLRASPRYVTLIFKLMVPVPDGTWLLSLSLRYKSILGIIVLPDKPLFYHWAKPTSKLFYRVLD